jgi:hypothetical protein
MVAGFPSTAVPACPLRPRVHVSDTVVADRACGLVLGCDITGKQEVQTIEFQVLLMKIQSLEKVERQGAHHVYVSDTSRMGFSRIPNV